MQTLSLPNAISRPAAYAIGLFASKGLALVMLPILTHHLSVEEIGKLELYTSSGVFIGLLISLALHEALYRFAGQEQTLEKQTQVASQIVAVSSSIALLALTFLLTAIFILHAWLTSFAKVELVLLAIGVSLEGLISLLLAWLRMRDRVSDFVRVTLSVCVLQVSLVCVALWSSLGVMGILCASVVAHVIQIVWLQKLCSLSLQLPSRNQLKGFIHYSLPIALSCLLAFVLNGAERWVIAANGSIELLAYYAVAAKFALALCILVQPFGMWWMPKRFAVLSNKSHTEATRITQYGLVWIAILCAFMAYFAPLFISLILPKSYEIAGQLVLLCLLAAVFKEITELVNLGLLAQKQTHRLLRFNLISTVIGTVLITLLLPFGVWGVISALILAQMLKLIFVYQASQTLLSLPYQLKALLVVYLISMAHLWLSSYLTDWHIQLFMCVIGPISVVIGSVLTGIISPQQVWRNRRYQQTGSA